MNFDPNPFPLTWEIRQISGGDRGADETVQAIKEAARRDAAHPSIRLLALELVRDLFPYDHRAEIETLHAFVRDEIRYTPDIHGLETVQTPRLTLEVGSGDCDDKTALLASLLFAVGRRVRYVLARTDPRVSRFTHVYLETPFQGRWIALDTIRPGKPAGWSPRQYGPAKREDGGTVYVTASDGLGADAAGPWPASARYDPRVPAGDTIGTAKPFYLWLPQGQPTPPGWSRAAVLDPRSIRKTSLGTELLYVNTGNIDPWKKWGSFGMIAGGIVAAVVLAPIAAASAGSIAKGAGTVVRTASRIATSAQKVSPFVQRLAPFASGGGPIIQTGGIVPPSVPGSVIAPATVGGPSPMLVYGIGALAAYLFFGKKRGR